MKNRDRFPFSLREILRGNEYENIIDSNIFSAYISTDLPIPKIDDPRKSRHSLTGIPRHPSFIRSPQINQIFSYIGYIKRVKDDSLKEHLPMLFDELNKFYHIFVDIIFKPDVSVPEEIFSEQVFGLRHFMDMFNDRPQNESPWIENIWTHQMNYLENLERILYSLKRRGKVFDCRDDPFHKKIMDTCFDYFSKKSDSMSRIPGNIDISFVANSCLKAQRDSQPKTIWSSDSDVKAVIEAIYSFPQITQQFPQIYLKAGYLPLLYQRLYPE